MADIYSSGGSDSWIAYIGGGGESWATCRDAATGTHMDRHGVKEQAAISATYRKGDYRVFRSFFFFDTSGISSTPSVANLKIYGYRRNGADMFVIRSIDAWEIGDVHFDAIVEWDDSGVDNEGNVTKYSDEITSWSTTGYNTISLNAEARERINTEDLFEVCLIESVHDLRNVAPTDPAAWSGCYFANATGTANDPYLEVDPITATDNSVFFGCNF